MEARKAKTAPQSNLLQQKAQRRPVLSSPEPAAPVEKAKRAVKLIKKAKPAPEEAPAKEETKESAEIIKETIKKEPEIAPIKEKTEKITKTSKGEKVWNFFSLNTFAMPLKLRIYQKQQRNITFRPRPFR